MTGPAQSRWNGPARDPAAVEHSKSVPRCGGLSSGPEARGGPARGQGRLEVPVTGRPGIQTGGPVFTKVLTNSKSRLFCVEDQAVFVRIRGRSHESRDLIRVISDCQVPSHSGLGQCPPRARA